MAKKKRQIKNIVPVEINGESMFLKYNVFAVKRMEEIGLDLSKFTPETKVSVDDVIRLLYCGLSTYDPDLTLDEVYMLVDIGEIPELADRVMEALNGTAQGAKQALAKAESAKN